MTKTALRFKDEQGLDFPEWEEKTLGELYSITSSKRVFQNEWTKSGIPFYRAREIVKLSEAGYVDNELFISLAMYNSYKAKYGVPKCDDLLVTGVGTLGRLYVVKDCDEFYFKDGNIIWFKSLNRVDSQFIKQLFETQIIKKQIEDGASITTVGTYTIESANKTKIPYPSIKEQTKIASFLTMIDKKITQLTQKHELLNQYKKGVMQQIFSQELRFKNEDGTEFPEWEKKEVGEVFKATRGNVLAMPLVSETPTNTHVYPVYSSQTKNNGLSGYYNEYLFENCITWTTDGANAGDVNFRNGKFYCTNVCGVLISNDGHANTCIAAMINAISRKYVSYVGNPKLMNGVMAKIVIGFPCLKEQTKIANFLTAIDDKITASQSQLELVKQYKQGLLQQMFV